MHALSQPIDPVAGPRALTPVEIDQVTGGVLPIVAGAIVTMVVASIVNSFGDNSSEEEEEQSED